MTLMTADQAREFRAAHDERARVLTRMTRAALRDLRATRFRNEGIIWISGGPSSKDELVRDLLERDYPIDTLNETIHVLYHKPGENWSACEHCGPAVGATRVCPDCGQPQHYTGTENGWCHDATFATLACGASPALLAELEK